MLKKEGGGEVSDFVKERKERKIEMQNGIYRQLVLWW